MISTITANLSFNRIKYKSFTITNCITIPNHGVRNIIIFSMGISELAAFEEIMARGKSMCRSGWTKVSTAVTEI